MPTDGFCRQGGAEKGDRKRGAAWWDVAGAEVDEAIEFEIRMAA